MRGKILLVDEDSESVAIAESTLREADFEISRARDGAEAVSQLGGSSPDVIVMDLELPDVSGFDLLEKLRETSPMTPVVVLPAEGDAAAVERCRELGAVDYVQKPCDPTRLVTSVDNAQAWAQLQHRVDDLQSELRQGVGLDALLGSSEAIRRSRTLLGRAAANQVPVLLLGEGGTGKELAARAVHSESPRSDGPLVVVSCGAVPEGTLESELFGHEAGALPGATAARKGCFEQANLGTLYLDEVDRLSPAIQVRVLRVLAEGKVQRVGSDRSIDVDVRIIAATDRDLFADAQSGAFRKDLYYKLAVFPVTLPPLRERGGDVLLLSDAFLRRFTERYSRRIRGFSREARAALLRHAWPGNVRELENAVERAVLIEDGALLARESLPPEVLAAGNDAARGPAPAAGDPDEQTMEVRLSHVPAAKKPPTVDRGPTETDILPFVEEERRIVERALRATGWNIARAAKALRIGRARLYRKIEMHGLVREQKA